MNKDYVIDNFVFCSKREYERALKEKETIEYLRVNTDLSNPKAVYQIYKKAIQKQSFQTIFGFEFMQELRKCLVDADIVPENVIDFVPVGRVQITEQSVGKKTETAPDEAEEKIKQYEEMAERAKAGSIIKNFLIAVLLIMVVLILVMTYNSKYSVFTFFTDYENQIREEVLDEYEEWENELKLREEKVEQAE